VFLGFTKILVMGGSLGSSDAQDVEVIDLDSPTSICSHLGQYVQHYPATIVGRGQNDTPIVCDEASGSSQGPKMICKTFINNRWTQSSLTQKYRFIVKLVGLLGFAKDFYCQLCLYVPLFLGLYISLYLCLSQTYPNYKYACPLTRPPAPPPLLLFFKIRKSLLLRLIFGWTNSFIF
jgi:hypothetical protein